MGNARSCNNNVAKLIPDSVLALKPLGVYWQIFTFCQYSFALLINYDIIRLKLRTFFISLNAINIKLRSFMIT